MTVSIIGIGLIGGSMALTLKDKGMAGTVIGVDANEVHAQTALQLGLVDSIASLEEAVAGSDLVILAVPVNAAEKLLPAILDLVDKQVVMDVGSTKEGILESVKDHPK